MGGMNHQPSRTSLTGASAWLSQLICAGYISVLEANNFLEDAIIIGMDGRYVENMWPGSTLSASQNLNEAVARLEKSIETVAQIETAFDNLVSSARIDGYVGNPLASRLQSFNLAGEFNTTLVRPSINLDIWNEIELRIGENNILDTLLWERDQFHRLREPTVELIESMQKCALIAELDGPFSVVDHLESNSIHLRKHYARVFSTWNYLHSMFLYSALIMTELFYKTHNLPSLTSHDEIRDIERAA